MPNQGKLLKTQNTLSCVLLRAYLGYSLKSMSQKYQYLFIAIMWAKMSRVTWALVGTYVLETANVVKSNFVGKTILFTIN